MIVWPVLHLVRWLCEFDDEWRADIFSIDANGREWLTEVRKRFDARRHQAFWEPVEVERWDLGGGWIEIDGDPKRFIEAPEDAPDGLINAVAAYLGFTLRASGGGRRRME